MTILSLEREASIPNPHGERRAVARRYRRVTLVLAGFQRVMNRWLEAAIIRWEHRAARLALHRLDDRALMDIGVPRSSIDYTVDQNARSRLRQLLRS